MTDERLAELRALSDACGPGPWVVKSYMCPGTWMTHAVGQDPENNPRMVLSMARDPELAFIVSSRTAIPELLDDIERLKAELVLSRSVNANAINAWAEGADPSDVYEILISQITIEQAFAAWESLATENDNEDEIERLEAEIERLKAELAAAKAT